jgi:hypothetical protein
VTAFANVSIRLVAVRQKANYQKIRGQRFLLD